MAVGDNYGKTRQIILERARELFLSQGYHKTTMRMIAKAAAISTGPLYFHFQNKAEVYFHICSDALDCLLQACREGAESETHAGLKPRAVYYAYKAFYYREPQLFAILHLANYSMGGIELPQELAETLSQKGQKLVELMELLIRDGVLREELRPVDPRKLALYLYSVAEGIFLSSRLGILQQRAVTLDDMIDAAIDYIGLGMLERREKA